MSGRKLFGYPEERAIEDAAYARGVAPTRIFQIMFPVRRVEIRSTVTESEPYELIDRYLERGIAEAQLDTAAALAEFFALDQVVVKRALRFLARTGHLDDSGARLTLTELGMRSVRDKVRYTISVQDRRKLYFDAFDSRPLTRHYYASNRINFLSGTEALAAATRGDGPSFSMLTSMKDFRDSALTELANNSDRAHYNLPERIDNPEKLGAELVYLPMYVVRGVRDGQPCHLAYTPLSHEADAEFTELCGRVPEISGAFETANREALAQGRDLDQARQWLVQIGQRRREPERLASGTVRVTLPVSAFGRDGALALSKLGSFVVRGNDLLQPWCADKRTRQQVLLTRINDYLNSRSKANLTDLRRWSSQIARQLELGSVTLPELCALARHRDNHRLVERLEPMIT